MKSIRFLISTALVLSCFAACGGDEEPNAQTFQPQQRGQRGETCRARNDCVEGLACIRSVCSRDDFDVSSVAKQCDHIECSAPEDCCGGLPRERPAKCADYRKICEIGSFNDCVSGNSCAGDGECGSGQCNTGFCSGDGATCTSSANCAGACVDGTCSNGLGACTTSAECQGQCENRVCNCSNPDFAPNSAICNDPDCTQQLCTFTCEAERCVFARSCQDTLDCQQYGLNTCTNGKCVQCTNDTECNSDQRCIEDACSSVGCRQNEECARFHQCVAGKCEETGCTSDRECVLAGSGYGGVDPRLAKCLPSAGSSLKQCRIGCENDGGCGQFEVCEEGFCKFVGCENDQECRAYLGLENRQRFPGQPIGKAVCR